MRRLAGARRHRGRSDHQPDGTARGRTGTVRAAVSWRQRSDEGRPPAMSAFDLSGRVALVTGASRGLGQTFARALARAGADVAITSRTLDSLRTFQKEVESMGRRAVPLELDVRDEGSIRSAVEGAHTAFGQIDILVNNAGCNVRKRAIDVT